MDNLSIKYFLDLAECLNFSRAAATNDVPQSSFSKSIMRLEKEVGVELIDRSKRPISLTPAGNCLQRHFQKIARQYKTAMQELELYRKSASETLRVLICPRSYAIKNAFSDFMEQNQHIVIALSQTADIGTVIDTILKEDYDFAISPKPLLIPPQLKTTRLYDDCLYAAMSKENPLSSMDLISLQDLNGQTFVYSHFSTSLTRELQRYFDFNTSLPTAKADIEIGREQAFHNISRNLGVGLFLGRDITLFSPANTVYLPVRELLDFPVVLLEKVTAPDTDAKRTFRAWIGQHLENYVCPPIHTGPEI